ncbi:MAG: YXWGXW repeat-containing protein [Acetobacteraceae bacterium]
MKRLILAGVAVTLLGLGIGSAMAQPPMPYGPVPDPRYEAVPPPRHGYFWQPGRWQWNGHRYVWYSGHWVAGGPRHGQWIAGHWQWNGHRYVWVPARWG